MYEKADPGSLITVEPSYVEDVFLQEDIHKEGNKDDKGNVIAHCEDCDYQVNHKYQMDPKNVVTVEPLSTEKINIQKRNYEE